MPDEQGNPTPEEVMAEKMAELEKMKTDLTAERADMAAQRGQTDELNRTMAGLTDAIRTQNQPEPEVDPALEGEYDELDREERREYGDGCPEGKSEVSHPGQA